MQEAASGLRQLPLEALNIKTSESLCVCFNIPETGLPGFAGDFEDLAVGPFLFLTHFCMTL